MQDKYKELTDKLAAILQEKNQAYNNSFDKTIEKWGNAPIGIRLDDKINRIDSMLKVNDLSKNDESLIDNLFDLAGYSILAINNLRNRDLVTDADKEKYFND